jgi:hypothetical protein
MEMGLKNSGGYVPKSYLYIGGVGGLLTTLSKPLLPFNLLYTLFNPYLTLYKLNTLNRFTLLIKSV